MGVLRYGTSSWSAKGWVGPFYPPGTPPGAFLSYYATRFDTVEADTTYYRVPDVRMVTGWKSKLPDGFQLAAKFPRTVVHAGEGARPDAEAILTSDRARKDTDAFLSAMELLGDKCGPLVLQFPYFNKGAFASKEPFLERLAEYLGRLPVGPRIAVEVRNKNWIGDELLDLLREHGIGFVMVDLLYMPHPADLAKRFDLVTADFAYARLIGDRKAVEAHTKTFDEIVVDQTPRLVRWAELLHKISSSVPEAFVYANNHYAGHGPATIEELAQLVDELDASS